MKWTENELTYLKENYLTEEKTVITTNLQDRGWGSITKKASVLGLNRGTSKHNASILLDETNETYYWLGFLMADGHFGDRNIQLKISKDELPHLLRFKEYIKSHNHVGFVENACRLHVGDVKVVKELKKKFKISNKKTYEPCDITGINDDDLFLSFLTGFIDGDGSIWTKGKYSQLFVGCHCYWSDNLLYLFKRLYKILDVSDDVIIKQRINNSKLVEKSDPISYIKISKKQILMRFKKEIELLNIPFMKKKWDKIK